MSSAADIIVTENDVKVEDPRHASSMTNYKNSTAIIKNRPHQQNKNQRDIEKVSSENTSSSAALVNIGRPIVKEPTPKNNFDNH